MRINYIKINEYSFPIRLNIKYKSIAMLFIIFSLVTNFLSIILGPTVYLDTQLK